MCNSNCRPNTNIVEIASQAYVSGGSHAAATEFERSNTEPLGYSGYQLSGWNSNGRPPPHPLSNHQIHYSGNSGDWNSYRESSRLGYGATEQVKEKKVSKLPLVFQPFLFHV